MSRWNPPSPFARVMGLAVLALALASSAAAAAAAAKGAPLAATALDRADLDTTCSPCRDFARFANGGWIDRHTIPATMSSWSSFAALAERNRETLRQMLERAAADRKAKAGTETEMLGSYWCACMDSAAADAAGAKPIEGPLGEVQAIASAPDVPAVVASLHERGIPALFGFRSGQDPKHSEWQIAFASQGGLGLPDRDYYMRGDSAAVETRSRYVTHVAKSLALAGAPADRAADEANTILALETALARASMTAVQRRDPNATYHKIGTDSLRRLAPRFDWDRYLGRRGVAALDSINVTQPDFVRAVDSLIAAVPLEQWKSYLRWKVVDATAAMLSRAFAEEDHQFSRVLSGTEAIQPRWKRCLAWVDRDLGDLLGRAYVREHFPESARKRALELVANLEAALGDRIEALEWMESETRRRAIEKLRAFEENIGYPKTWRDYAGVRIGKTDLIDNVTSARVYEAKRNMAKIGKPVDRGEWFMTAPTVNAFYNSSLNSINFPAGILQPPFFDPSWDDAMNYGAIGAVIGHEMTHGFDDRGRQFDAQGNLRDWWTADDAANYKGRAQRVVEQFDAYTVLDTLHLNGRLTLGENIADLGGVAVAFHALQRALAKKPAPAIDGFSPEQRFFLSYARVWANLMRPAAMRTQVQTNSHSPPMWRVNGPLANLPEFARAWGCKAGDPMMREAERQARIW